MLQRLADQDRTVDTLVVVDNDSDESARHEVEALQHSNGGRPAVTYVAAGANLGPAGGIALGMRHVLERAADDDWVLPLDDDNPPTTPDLIAELEQFGARLRADYPNLGAVGLCGARFVPERARSVRVTDDELVEVVRSDWIGSGMFPLYSVRAMRAVGVFDERLFFGFDDLDYGLRLSAAGFPLFAHGEMWHRQRRTYGRLDLDGDPSRRLAAPTWRRYYSLRNLIYILRKQGHRQGAARLAARGLGKPAYNLPRHPVLAARHLALNIRAIADAYRGRMGLTVTPAPKEHS
jgi:GT2 family glycosyltransferase